MTLRERFEAMVEVITETGCWIWVGALKDNRYGSFHLAGKCVRAHRVSLELYNGVKLRPGQVAIHLCDVTLCVNPAHLRAGSQAENMRDCLAKGRHNSCGDGG